MSKELNKLKCPHKDSCKFADNCTVVVPVREGGSFTPVLKIRLEKLELKVKCFSYVVKED